MKIKNFCKEYNSLASQQLKNKYIKDNVKVTTYLPFLNKSIIAEKLAEVSMLNKENNNVHMKSYMGYLLFCRAIIENYTDLEIETEGFYEEYDELNKSGIFACIMAQIPESELKEFNMIVDMAKDDLLANKYENHAFISNQVTRVVDIIEAAGKPLFESLAKKIDSVTSEDLEKITSMVEKATKKTRGRKSTTVKK